MKEPNPALRRAFLQSSYGTAAERVWLSGQPSDAADPPPTWAQGHWSIITAWNPEGQSADSRSNEAQQQRLGQTLGKFDLLHGHNGEDEWQEPTFIVKDIDEHQLIALGSSFGQAAVLRGTGSAALLLWLDAEAENIACTEAVWLTTRHQ